MQIAGLVAASPPGSFHQFMEMLREPGTLAPIVSPRRFSIVLSMDLQSLAEAARVHRNTITRAPGSKPLQDYLRDALRVICAASDSAGGDVQKALFWYRNEPLLVFEYLTAEQLVSGGRTDDLIRYVMSLEAGAAG